MRLKFYFYLKTPPIKVDLQNIQTKLGKDIK